MIFSTLVGSLTFVTSDVSIRVFQFSAGPISTCLVHSVKFSGQDLTLSTDGFLRQG